MANLICRSSEDLPRQDLDVDSHGLIRLGGFARGSLGSHAMNLCGNNGAGLCTVVNERGQT